MYFSCGGQCNDTCCNYNDTLGHTLACGDGTDIKVLILLVQRVYYILVGILGCNAGVCDMSTPLTDRRATADLDLFRQGFKAGIICLGTLLVGGSGPEYSKWDDDDERMMLIAYEEINT